MTCSGVAIGTGRNLEFYQRDVPLVGIGFSPAMLEIARQWGCNSPMSSPRDCGRSFCVRSSPSANASPPADRLSRGAYRRVPSADKLDGLISPGAKADDGEVAVV